MRSNIMNHEVTSTKETNNNEEISIRSQDRKEVYRRPDWKAWLFSFSFKPIENKPILINNRLAYVMKSL